MEIQQDVDPAVEHLLVIGYRLQSARRLPMFTTQVNDLKGSGNEEMFPTINSPHELIRHRSRCSVDGDVPYRCIGVGMVEKTENTALQEWTLDSESARSPPIRIMFALAPAADTLYQERAIAGVPVRIVAFAGGASIDRRLRRTGLLAAAAAGRDRPFPHAARIEHLPDQAAAAWNTMAAPFHRSRR